MYEFAGVTFETEEEYWEFVNETRDQVLTQHVVNADNTITDSAGRNYLFETWLNRAVRVAIAQDLYNSTMNLLAQYEHNLVHITYFSDSSRLCLPYQNTVLWVFKRQGNLVGLEEAKANGLFHINCRHKMIPFFDDSQLVQDTISDNQVEINRKARQAWQNANNRYKNYQKKARELKAMGIDNSKAKSKAKEWKNRRDKMKQPDDGLFDVI